MLEVQRTFGGIARAVLHFVWLASNEVAGKKKRGESLRGYAASRARRREDERQPDSGDFHLRYVSKLLIPLKELILKGRFASQSFG